MYGMRRMILAVALLLIATTASAINTATRPLHVVLLASDRYLDSFRDRLQDELHALGYDLSTMNGTIRDLGDDRPRADYFVEILGAGGDSRPVAGIGAGPIDVGVSVSHVAASVNLYDGRTLELVDAIDLHKRSTNVSPTGIYIGSRPVWAAISLPFFEWSHYRSAMRKLARDTAREIDRTLRH